jgi:Cytochrome P460
MRGRLWRLSMKRYLVATAIVCAVILSVFTGVRQESRGQDAGLADTTSGTSSPVFVTEIPDGYRDWRLISVAREEGSLDDIRGVLGNDIAIQAYRNGVQAFPDGAMIARLAWSYVSSEENNKAFGRSQSFVAGMPKNGVQFMVKDSKKYAATGGWGYGQFNEGVSAGEEALVTCFGCHERGAARDFVFTRYAR